VLALYGIRRRVIAFVVRRGEDQPTAVELPLSPQQLDNYRERLITEVHHHDPASPLEETWAGLARVLLPAVLPHLDGVELLHVIPFGPLHHLPLHALSADGVALVDRFAIAYAPSVAVARRCSLNARAAGATRDPDGPFGSSVVVGNPTGDLPFAEAEAAAVAEMLGATPLLGSQATKARVAVALSQAAACAHLATHAAFVEADPFASGIVVAGGEVLAARDIARLESVPDLVVMSACETGLQGIQPGDELVGLARAMLFAGASTLVMSLWAVNDDTTSALMRRFYAHLANTRAATGGTSRVGAAEALRLAMLETRAEAPHTQAWAPFVLYGSAWPT
jgi:CHAT domain-containing protein